MYYLALGPDLNALSTACESKARSTLGIHVKSLPMKLDLVKIWVKSTHTDVVVLSETWLNKCMTDKDIVIRGYNVFHCDRPRKGGGVSIYIKNKLHVPILSSLSLSRRTS